MSSEDVAYVIYENRSSDKLTPLSASAQAPMRIAHLRRDGFTIIRNTEGKYELLEDKPVVTTEE